MEGYWGESKRVWDEMCNWLVGWALLLEKPWATL